MSHRIRLLGLVAVMIASGCSQSEPAVSSVPTGETAEIIRILEEEDIELIMTSHSQEIDIFLKNGQQFSGRYVHEQSGKYSKHDDLFDILNLVVYIQNQRSAEEKLSWSIIAE